MKSAHVALLFVAVAAMFDIGEGECQVNGRQYAVGYFSYDQGPWRFNCTCYRNGSWVCPPERTRRRVYYSRPSTTYPCQANGRRYRVGEFSYDQGRYRYNCTCYPNGSWICPAGRTQRRY